MEELKNYYDNWKRKFEIYKDLLEGPGMELGHYAMVTQEVYYCMCHVLEIINELKRQEEEKEILEELRDCVLSIRMHIINFRKQASHPYELETLNYLNSLFKRNLQDAPSDNELEELQNRIMEYIDKYEINML